MICTTRVPPRADSPALVAIRCAAAIAVRPSGDPRPARHRDSDQSASSPSPTGWSTDAVRLGSAHSPHRRADAHLVDQARRHHLLDREKTGHGPRRSRSSNCSGQGRDSDDSDLARGPSTPTRVDEAGPLRLVNAGRPGSTAGDFGDSSRRPAVPPAAKAHAARSANLGRRAEGQDAPLHVRDSRLDAGQGKEFDAAYASRPSFCSAVAATAADAAVRHFSVAAVPSTWNVIASRRDRIMGGTFVAAETSFRRSSAALQKGWKSALPNAPPATGRPDLIPGPLLRVLIGDQLLVPFRHGHDYSKHRTRCTSTACATGRARTVSTCRASPAGTGTSIRASPGVPLRAGRDAAGVWPCRDHSPSMHHWLRAGCKAAVHLRIRQRAAGPRVRHRLSSP